MLQTLPEWFLFCCNVAEMHIRYECCHVAPALTIQRNDIPKVSMGVRAYRVCANNRFQFLYQRAVPAPPNPTSFEFHAWGGHPWAVHHCDISILGLHRYRVIIVIDQPIAANRTKVTAPTLGPQARPVLGK